MKLTPNAPLKRGIDDLVLPDPAQPGEAPADHPRGVMIAVARKVADRDVGVGDRGLDQRFDLARRHRHQRLVL